MKKITSFLTLMLMLFFSSSAMADVMVVDEDADNLIEDVSQITTTVNQPGEGSIAALLDGDPSTYWHSIWSNGNQPNGTHFFQVSDVDVDEWFGFSFTRRSHGSDQITVWSVYGVPEGMDETAAKSACTLLATVETPFTSGNYGPFFSPAIESKGFKSFRFYAEATTNNRGYWHCAEFAILPCKGIGDREAALIELANTYAAYSTYTFDGGDGYGQYNKEAADAFAAALDAASIVDTPEGEELTAEQLKALNQAIIDTYNAVKDTRKPFAMAVTPGYYQIISALDFTSTVTTEDTEDPETGDIIPGETIKTHHQKGLYDNNGNPGWKDVEATAPFLFKVEATDKYNQYKVTNMHSGLTFDPIKTSTAATMSATDSLMVFDWRWDDVTVYTGPTDSDTKQVTTVNIRLAAQAERGSVYVHANSHGGGSGKSGNIVGWSTGTETEIGASDWYLVPVDEEVALAWIEADQPVKIITAMIDSVNAIKATYADQKFIAEDKTSVVDTENPVITSGEQLYSPDTTLDEQDTTEEDIYAAIISNKGSVYWHSAWENGAVAQHTHYLQVKDVELDGTYAVKITRRNVNNDHITKLRVLGYTEDNEALGFEDGVDLGLIELPFGTKGETLFSTTVFTATPDYPVIRFYSEEEIGATAAGSNRGYWHAVKFQIYPAIMGFGAETTQATAHAAEMTALEEALAAFEAGNFSTTTVTDPKDEAFVAAYEAVINANNAWQAVYADPAELRTAINAAETLAGNIVVGTDPGMWADAASTDALTSAIEAGKAYNNKGNYTEEGVKAQAETINNAAAAVANAANKPSTDKWYALKFDSEDNYDAKHWDKANTNNALGALFDNVVAPANVVDEQLESPEGVYVGQALRFVSENDVDDEQMAFRFVKHGEDTYVLQHKSGLYVAPNGQLSLYPAVVSVKAIGLGKNLIQATGLDTEEDETPVYLHAQLAGHLLVTWSSDEISSNSALFIHEVNVSGEADAPKMAVNPNGMKIMCYPISISASEGDFYELAGRKFDGDDQVLCFNKVEATTAGKAALYVIGTPENQDDEDEASDEVTLTTDASEISAPVEYNGMHGTYKYEWPSDEGTSQVVVVAREHYASFFGYTLATMASTDKNGSHVYDSNGNEGRDVQAYTGWIELDETPEVSGNFDLEITINGDLTGIQNVISEVEKAGKIYTIDGKFLGNGNINTIKNMGRGIYVINGVKVAIK